jgi:hypothetical protein
MAATGDLSIPATLPAGLSGLGFDVQALAVSGTSTALVSNALTLSFL